MTNNGVPMTRRRPAEVRSLLLEAAAHEFSRNGYASTTKKDIAAYAEVALSVLDRHFETKANLFSEAVLVPFAELLEQTSRDWLRQRDEPLRDDSLMRLVLSDMCHSLAEHRNALKGLLLAKEELGEEITSRLRDAFDDLFRQLRLMAELEAERRQWFSADGLDLTLRILMGMAMGNTAYDWILLPDDPPDPDRLVDAMSQIALWGIGRVARP
jgi:AcrR family transcriptional regulator